MNADKMIEMLALSSAAYLDKQSFSGYDTMHTIDDAKSGVQCYIRTKGEEVFITFRGTNSTVDRYKNIMFCKKCSPFEESDRICVHRGFLSAYMSEDVREKIHLLVSSRIKSVTLCGHSLGAAMAILCAYDLQKSYPALDYEVYLYGSPRVGNYSFMRSYNKRLIKTVRVENGNDIVCKIPPALFGYRHVGSSFHIGKRASALAFSFAAHYPDDYFEKMLSSLFLHKG